MADNQAEPKVPAQEKEKEKPKQPSGLETMVNDSKSFVNGLATSITVAGGFWYGSFGATTWSEAINPGLQAASVVASQPLSTLMRRESPTSKELKNDGIYGLIQLPVFDYTSKIIQSNAGLFGLDSTVNILNQSISATSLAAGGLTLATGPILAAGFYPIRYFLNNNYSLKGFWSNFKKNYASAASYTTAFWGIPTAIAMAAGFAVLPAAALGNILFRFAYGYKTQKPEEKKPLLQYTYQSVRYFVKNMASPFAGLASIGGRAYRGINSAAYDIGSAVTKTLGSLFKPAPKPAPAAQPA